MTCSRWLLRACRAGGHRGPGNVPFGSPSRWRPLLVAEAGDNAVATFTVNGTGSWPPGGDRAGATCWIARDGSLFYASNAGSGTLSGYGDDGSGTLQPLGRRPPTRGPSTRRPPRAASTCTPKPAANGIVDEFRVGSGGSLTEIGSVTVPGAVGAEGIAAS